MPNRIIRDGINDSETVNALSMRGEIFYRRLMSLVDDYGRFEARGSLLRSKLFGQQLNTWSEEEVLAAMAECSAVGSGEEKLLTVYIVGGKRYLQMNNFQQRTRSMSKHPGPTTKSTVKCAPVPAVVSHMTVIGEQMPDKGPPDGCHVTAVARLDGDVVVIGDGDVCGDVIVIEGEDPEAAAAGEFVLASSATEAKKPKRIKSGNELRTEAEVKTTIVLVAEEIHARHPSGQGCGKAVIGRLLGEIVNAGGRFALYERVAALKRVNANHAAWCKTEQWQNGYAKGLENWLCASKLRWEDPPPEAGAGDVALEGHLNPNLRMT